MTIQHCKCVWEVSREKYLHLCAQSHKDKRRKLFLFFPLLNQAESHLTAEMYPNLWGTSHRIEISSFTSCCPPALPCPVVSAGWFGQLQASVSKPTVNLSCTEVTWMKKLFLSPLKLLTDIFLSSFVLSVCK